MAQPALILFAHGSRDAAWAEPFLRLQALVQARRPDAMVELAFLELMEPRLPDLAARLLDQGCRDIVIVPVFLAQGGHVRRDLPVMVERLRAAYPDARLTVAPAVGESEGVREAMAGYCAGMLEEGRGG